MLSLKNAGASLKVGSYRQVMKLIL